MEKLYAIYPGEVASRHDNDWHHISAAQLAHLYRVPMEICVIVDRGDYAKPWRRDHVAYAATLIPLRPRYNGDYSLRTTFHATGDIMSPHGDKVAPA